MTDPQQPSQYPQSGPPYPNAPYPPQQGPHPPRYQQPYPPQYPQYPPQQQPMTAGQLGRGISWVVIVIPLIAVALVVLCCLGLMMGGAGVK